MRLSLQILGRWTYGNDIWKTFRYDFHSTNIRKIIFWT